ncbi:MAG: DUF4184 family protein, partial [Bacteroidota bacterium]
LAYLPRKWVSLTGLIIGSLSPDFEYFFRMRIKSDYSHTLDGLFWFDLPLGLCLAFIFHNIVRDSLFHNLPTFFRSRFWAFGQFSWNDYFRRKWFVVVISILIGAASHIFWDGFTHSQGYFVEKIPVLNRSVNIWDTQIPILKILQHLSTLIGGSVIMLSIYKLPVQKDVEEDTNKKYWSIVGLLMLTIVVLRFLSGLEWQQFGNVIVTVIAAGLLSVTLTPLILNKGKM